jgi:NAD(P)-dependent dehydrogenase (short-subunit alcohol dehydrogenase family)
MGDSISRTVLVTGCSSGIGHATAARLAGHGWAVYATARRPETLTALAAMGCRTLALDVTDEASMTAAMSTVDRERGGLGVLVNNAGYSQSGPLEELPLEELRRQFETNVFGLLRMAQLALPGMRARGWGRIVNLGSMGGRLTFPGGGAYHATKYALEAISDALRFEVAGFGVGVVLIEPGLIRTNFGATAVGSMDTLPTGDGPYADFSAAVSSTTAAAYAGMMGRVLGAGPEAVARVIERAITARRPRARYVVTPGARVMIGLHAVLPDRAFDAVLARQFPRPRG